MHMDEILEEPREGLSLTTDISKGSKVTFSSGLWECLADVTTSLSKWPYEHQSTIEGTVVWIDKDEERQLVAIQTDEPVFQGHIVKGIPKESHGIVLPSHLVAAIQHNVSVKQQPHYNMTCRPHGLALVIVDSRITAPQSQVHAQAYLFLKIFEHFNYSVQHYTFSDTKQLIDMATQISTVDHTPFDSFACYISLGGPDTDELHILQVLDIIQTSGTLENKPKMFFVKTKFPLSLSSITSKSNFQDSFLFAAQENDTDQFEAICYSVFRHDPHDNLLSMATNASLVKYMAGVINDDYIIVSQLKGPVNFFNEKISYLGYEIIPRDVKNLSNVEIPIRCSYVSVIGPPNSGRSLVMKMLRHEPMLMKDHASAMIFRPDVKATSLVALNHNDLSQPFEYLNVNLLLSAAKDKVQSAHISKRNSLPRRLGRLRKQPQAMHLVHVVNSGGHPFFLDLFGHLLKHHSFNIFTHKLSKTLNTEITFRCSIDGQIFDSPRNQPLTNLLYIKELARCLVDMNPHENSSLLVLGTFVNSLAESLPQNESVQEKSEKIQELFEDFRGLSPIYTENDLIFVMDAIMRKGREEPDARLIRQKICSSYENADIPIRWFLFQLELIKHRRITSENVVHIKFCYETGRKFDLEEGDVDNALKCFCDMNIFLHFKSVLPEIIFLDPQPILDKLSEIWCLSDPRIVEKLKKNKTVFVDVQKQLQLKGLLEQDLVVQNLTDGFSDLFTAENFLKIANHLSIILSLPDNMLFFPKVLPEVDTDCILFEVVPIVFNWDKKLIPKSFYRKLIQQLLRRHSFPTFTFCVDSSEPQYRNAVYLKNSEIGGAVVVVDAMNWIEVHYTGPPHGRKCHNIKKAVLEAIASVLEQKEYPTFKVDKLQTCFFCDHCPDTKDHLCVYSHSNKTLTCCADGVYLWPKLNEKQKLWFVEDVSDDSILTARALSFGSVNVTLTKFLIFGGTNSGKTSTTKLLLNEDLEKSRGNRFHTPVKDNSPTRTTLMISSQNTETGSITWDPLTSLPKITNNQDLHLVLGLESGGDATFLDIAPFLMGPSSVALYTQPLDAKFDDMTRFYYNINGKIIGEPEEYQIPYIQLFQETLRSLLAPTLFKEDIIHADENKCMKMFLIGTRKDLRGKVLKKEKTSDKNQIIKMHCQEYASKIVKYREDCDKTIFPVNNLSRSGKNSEIANRLRKLISEQNIKFRIPVSWCHFLMNLQELSIANAEMETEQCIEIGAKHGLDRDNVIAALKFFSNKTIFLYFPGILPEIVFLRPQLLLCKLSELVSLGFPKMASIMHRELPARAHENMSKYGIFERDLLKEFFWKGIHKFFTVEGFLSLMERWSIIAPLGHDVYFLPRALPVASQSVIMSLHETFTAKAAVFVINWDALFPREIFLAVLNELICHRDVAPFFEYILYKVTQWRNAIQLKLRTELGNVLLVDAGNWLEVSYLGIPEKCRMIRDAIELAISNVTKRYGYDRKYKICFFCDKHKDGEEHLSELDEETNLVTCVKTLVHTPASEKQKYWLKPVFNYSNQVPKVADLTRIFSPFSKHWFEIGLSLMVPYSTLQWIQHQAMSAKMKLYFVLQEWDKVKDKWEAIGDKKTTWQTVIDIILEEPISSPSLKHEIEMMAQKSITLQKEVQRTQQSTFQSFDEVSQDSPKQKQKSQGLTDIQLRRVARKIPPDIVEDFFSYLDMEEDYEEMQAAKKKHQLVVYKLLKKWVQNRPEEDAKQELVDALEDMELEEAKQSLFEGKQEPLNI